MQHFRIECLKKNRLLLYMFCFAMYLHYPKCLNTEKSILLFRVRQESEEGSRRKVTKRNVNKAARVTSVRFSWWQWWLFNNVDSNPHDSMIIWFFPGACNLYMNTWTWTNRYYVWLTCTAHSCGVKKTSKTILYVIVWMRMYKLLPVRVCVGACMV